MTVEGIGFTLLSLLVLFIGFQTIRTRTRLDQELKGVTRWIKSLPKMDPLTNEERAKAEQELIQAGIELENPELTKSLLEREQHLAILAQGRIKTATAVIQRLEEEIVKDLKIGGSETYYSFRKEYYPLSCAPYVVLQLSKRFPHFNWRFQESPRNPDYIIYYGTIIEEPAETIKIENTPLIPDEETQQLGNSL